MKLRYVISGGQTGADQAGLRAAKRCGLVTGGMMPKGWRTEDGAQPAFQALYGMLESSSADYPPRTRWNVLKSDGTVIFARTRDDGSIIDTGSKLTRDLCEELGKPWLCIDLTRVTYQTVDGYVNRAHVVAFLRTLTTVNIAGNAESRIPGIGGLVERFLLDVLPRCRQTQAEPTPLSPTT